jgi:hypothetical protein
MPAFLIALLIIFLLIFLLSLVTRERGEDQWSSVPGNPVRCGHDGKPEFTKLVRRIFSTEDWDFISQMGSPRLRRIYGEERRRVALHWVRQTSRDLTQVMRTHRLASRRSPDLDAGAEARLSLQYWELRCTCALLLLLLHLFGPHALARVAAYAGELYAKLDPKLTATAPLSPAESSGSSYTR